MFPGLRLVRLASVSLLCSPILMALTLRALPVMAADPAFRPLFNGRDLRGWVNVNCAPETFTVRDGMIHCDGVPTGALRTERQYENFILELEWRHLKAGGNAGVFIWSGPMPALGQPFLRAIEVQVLDHGYGKSDWFTTHGDIFPIHGSTMKPFSPSRGDRSFPKESRSLGAPDWNHYRIVATNGVIRLSVNGVEVSGGSACQWRRGYIALESEGGIVDPPRRRLPRSRRPKPARGRVCTMAAASAVGGCRPMTGRGRPVTGLSGAGRPARARRPCSGRSPGSAATSSSSTGAGTASLRSRSRRWCSAQGGPPD